METLRTLQEHLNRPIITRILKQFGNFEVILPIDKNKSDAQLFFDLTRNRGAGKSHCSKHYPKHEGKIKKS